MLPVVTQAGAVCWSGVEDAEADAPCVALDSDVADAPPLEVAVGPVPVGSLLSRLMVSRVATIASATARPMTIHVIALRRRSGSDVIPRP